MASRKYDNRKLLTDTFSTTLLKTLNEQQLSQRHFADLADISHKIVSNWCQGEALPSLMALDKVCQALECTPNDLMGY